MSTRFLPCASSFLVLAVIGLGPVLGRAAAPEGPAAAASKPAAAPAAFNPTELVFVESQFADDANDAKFGRDIFFPSTKRFVKAAPVNPAAVVRGENPVLSQLVLKGISGTAGRPLAVVNNHTLAPGESWELKVNGQVHRIVCEEIKPRSVLVSIEGSNDKKELHLREGL